jgi:hypothetical protein
MILDDLLKLILRQGPEAADAARGVVRNNPIPPTAGQVNLSGLKLPPRGHNGGPPIQDPYVFSGQAAFDRLQGIPTAREIAGRDRLPTGSGYTGVKSRQGEVLPQHTSRGYETGLLADPVQLDIADAQGRTLMGVVGDNSGRKIVTQVDDRVLREPVNTEGGFQYMDEGTQGYAGALGPTNSKANEAKLTDNPLYVSIMMAEQSPDFARPTGNIFGQLFEQAPILQKDIAAIDEHIRSIGVSVKREREIDGKKVKYSETVYPFQNFESVKDPAYLGRYIQDLPSGSLRASLLKGLDRKTLQVMGVPDVASARLAMVDENQVGMDWGTAGYRAIVPDLERGVYATTPNQSTTYQAGIDKIGPSYSFTGEGRGIPAGLMFPKMAELLRLKGTGGELELTSPAYKQFEGSPKAAKSLVDQMVVDMVSAFRQFETSRGREPAMRYANAILGGGEVTSDMIRAAEKLKAPKWVIAAMTAAAGGGGGGGLMSMQPESEQY